MIFSSIPFLFYFLPLFLILYYLIPSRFRNLVLLAFSLVFYGWGEPVYILLLIISASVDYVNGILMERAEGNRNRQKLFLILSITINLGLLCVFKYGNLLINSVNSVLHCDISMTGLALPIGISFYTFQTMSYCIDVYRGTVKAEHNYINYMTFVSMFPQLIAGPIVRYEDVHKELRTRRVVLNDFCDGTIIFMMGMFKKVLIANQIGSLWDTSIVNIADLGVMQAWLGAAAYTLQIYFDFSGYSDMAIGMGRMMGFNYPQNFNYPYMSCSITEFWRRWHMTLSGWFRSYVYIPLGGNQRGRVRSIINLLIVWSLTGLWHGAGWNFLAWGLYFAIILIIEKYVLKRFPDNVPSFLKHMYTVVLLMISWVIFAIEDAGDILSYFGAMFGLKGNSFIDQEFLYNIRNYGVVLIVGIVLCAPVYRIIQNRISLLKYRNTVYSIAALGFIGLFIVTVSCLVRNTYNPFLYFRF